MTFRFFWLPAVELRWGWSSLLQLWVSRLPAVCAACWLRQLARQSGWGFIGFLLGWEPCLNLRICHYPGQFSERWRQPVLPHFYKQIYKRKPQHKTAKKKRKKKKKKKYSSLLEKQIMCCWKAMKSSCGYLMLLVYFRPLWVRSPIDVRGSLTCLTGWIEILEMLEEHLKSFTLFTKICVST